MSKARDSTASNSSAKFLYLKVEMISQDKNTYNLNTSAKQTILSES